jgi:cell fate (sporulation/competence/biofilm development) regulator YmcA (YheA/YmcA/DUF963 family)
MYFKNVKTGINIYLFFFKKSVTKKGIQNMEAEKNAEHSDDAFWNEIKLMMEIEDCFGIKPQPIERVDVSTEKMIDDFMEIEFAVSKKNERYLKRKKIWKWIKRNIFFQKND